MRTGRCIWQILLIQTLVTSLYVIYFAFQTFDNQMVERLREDLYVRSGRNTGGVYVHKMTQNAGQLYMYSFEYLQQVREFASQDHHLTGDNAKLILYVRDRGTKARENVDAFFNWCYRPTTGPCRVTYNKSLSTTADAVIFDASKIESAEPPFEKKPGQVWVARGRESSPYWLPGYRSPAWRGVFNWTMTYMPNSDIFFPIGVLVELNEPTGIDYTMIARNKTRPVAWFVSDCDTFSRREDYVKELQKYIEVDIFGKCGPLVCPKKGNTCNDMLSEKYRFYLSFENSFCPYYVTEKLFSKFRVYNSTRYNNIIPIVRGGFDYRQYIPDGTYINTADFATPRELAEYLDYLGKDENAYAAMLERKANYGSHPHLKGEAWCKLCDMLHDDTIAPKVYRDLGAWWDQTPCLGKQSVTDI